MKANLLLFVFLAGMSFIHAQKSYIDSLRARSEIVAHIKVTEIIPDGDMDLGATQVHVKSTIQHVYKGNPDKDNPLNFTVVVWGDNYNWDRMKVGAEYFVFLKYEHWEMGENAKPTLTLADKWLGIQPWYKEMSSYLLRY